MPRCSKSPRSLAIGRELIARKPILPWRGIEILIGFEPAFITLRNRIVYRSGQAGIYMLCRSSSCTQYYG